MRIVEKVCGGLLALAVGDALGFPYEGLSREAMASKPLDTYAEGPYPPGTWSDDTALTFCTVASLLERDGFAPEDLARKFALWLTQGFMTPFGKAIGVGRSTRQAIERYLGGTPPLKCGGTGERSNGNGSLMRILPVALFYARAPVEQMLDFVHQASCLTHAHPRSQMACGFYSLLIRELLRGQKRKKAFSQAQEAFVRFYAGKTPFGEELQHFDRVLRPALPLLPRSEIRSSAYVVHSLEASCWVFLRAADLAQALREAISLGHDTDTIGAITGGLAGVYWGVAAIPHHLLAELAEGGKLENLARQFGRKIEERYAT